MKKFVGSLFMLLVAGGAAAPYVSGYYTKKYYYDAVDALSSFQEGQIEIEAYEMSWLSSTVRLKAVLSKNSFLCAGSEQPLVLKFEDNIQHGPLIFGAGSIKPQLAFAKIQGKFLGIDEQLSKTCTNLVDFKWPIPPSQIYSYESMVTFNGDFHLHIKSQPFEFQKNDTRYKWQGMNGDINLEKKMSVLNYKLTVPSIEAQEGNQVSLIQLKDMLLSGQYQKMKNDDVWLGEMKFNLSTLHLQEDKWIMQLNGLTFKYAVTLENNLLSATANYIVDSVAFNKIKLGPINMMFSIHHIEPSLVEMFENFKQMDDQSPEGYMSELKKYQSKNKEDALTMVNNQLKQSPEIRIDHVVQFSQGELLLNAIASVGGPEAKLDSLENYMMLILMAKASGDFSMDEGVFDYVLEQQSQETANKLPKEFWAQQQTQQKQWIKNNVEKLKDQAIKTGAFVKEGKKMISRFKYENNNLTINGKNIQEIIMIYIEMNQPKPVLAPAPVPGQSFAPMQPGQVQPQSIVNNPNDPAKPSEPLPVSEINEVPKVEVPKVEVPLLRPLPPVTLD